MTVLFNSSPCTESAQLLIIGLGETIWTDSTFQIFLLVLLLFLTLLADHSNSSATSCGKTLQSNYETYKGFKAMRNDYVHQILVEPLLFLKCQNSNLESCCLFQNVCQVKLKHV